MNKWNSCMDFLHETDYFRIHKRPQNAIYYRRGRHPYRDSNPNYSRCADVLFASCAYTCCVYYRMLYHIDLHCVFKLWLLLLPIPYIADFHCDHNWLRTFNGCQKWVYEEQTIVKFIIFSLNFIVAHWSRHNPSRVRIIKFLVFSHQVIGFGFDDN